MKRVKKAVAILTVLVMLVSLSAGLAGCKSDTATAITLEADTVTELYVNNSNTVVQTSDALNGLTLEKAIAAVIGDMIQNGELDEEENTVLITVADTAAQATVADYVAKAFQAQSFTGAAICQIVDEAATPGKALLAKRMAAAFDKLSDDTLVQLSINQLKLLCEADEAVMQGVTFVGTASQALYVGADTALEVALIIADTSAEEATDAKVFLDYSDLMFYNVTFSLNGTAMEAYINADSGELLYSGIVGGERTDDDVAPEFTEENALAAACISIGADVAAVKDVMCEFVDFSLTPYFDVSFTYQGQQYSIMISTVTGQPLEGDVAPSETIENIGAGSEETTPIEETGSSSITEEITGSDTDVEATVGDVEE